ncbi:T9SS type A sorting domain-containing protein [Bizionia sp. KMM 8389]
MKTSRKNKYLVLIALFIGCFNFQAQTVDLVASVNITPPLNNGQTFTYSIMSTGGPYRAIRLNIIYNPSVIQLNSLSEVFPFSFVPVNDISTPGLIRFEAAYFDSDITGNETLLNIEFEVLDNTQTISIAQNYNPTSGTVVVNGNGIDVLSTANDIILETLSRPINIKNTSITIYPNPVTDLLYIESEKSIKNVTIYTILGGKVLETKNTTIDVKNLQSGNYFIKINTDLGQTVKKLIIK